MALVLAHTAAPVAAQATAPISPGSLGLARGKTRESVEKSMEAARWRLGPLRFGPWVELDEISYVDNVFGATEGDKVSDVKTSITAGLYGHVPIGEKLVFTMAALPSYTQWADLTELSGWYYRYGAGLFGYYNRLTMDARAEESRQQQIVDPRVSVPADQKTRMFTTSAVVRVLRRLSVLAEGSQSVLSYLSAGSADLPSEAYGNLDRDELRTAAGLRYRWSDDLALGIGMQTSDIEFQEDAGNRSNSGEGLRVDLSWSLGSVALSVGYANMKLRADGDAHFKSYDGLLGRSQLGWEGGRGWGAGVYAGRSLSFGYGATSVSEDERYGANIAIPTGWRVKVRGFAETGTITTTGLLSSDETRSEDVDAYGVDANVDVNGWLVRAGLTHSVYSGWAAGEERPINTFRISLSPPGAFQHWW